MPVNLTLVITISSVGVIIIVVILLMKSRGPSSGGGLQGYQW
jgi:preprotein translocase subunit SecG